MLYARGTRNNVVLYCLELDDSRNVLDIVIVLKYSDVTKKENVKYLKNWHSIISLTGNSFDPRNERWASAEHLIFIV